MNMQKKLWSTSHTLVSKSLKLVVKSSVIHNIHIKMKLPIQFQRYKAQLSPKIDLVDEV